MVVYSFLGFLFFVFLVCLFLSWSHGFFLILDSRTQPVTMFLKLMVAVPARCSGHSQHWKHSGHTMGTGLNKDDFFPQLGSPQSISARTTSILKLIMHLFKRSDKQTLITSKVKTIINYFLLKLAFLCATVCMCKECAHQMLNMQLCRVHVLLYLWWSQCLTRLEPYCTSLGWERTQHAQ